MSSLAAATAALAEAIPALVQAGLHDPTAVWSGPGGPQNGINVSVGVGGGALGSFLTTLIVGAILVAISPKFTERMMADVVDDPLGSFVYGVIALVGLIVVIIVLVITIIGIFVAIPLIVVAVLLWAAGAAIGFLAIAERLVGRDDGWAVPLLVAALLNGGFALTGIGGLVSFVVGAAGFGAILRHLL